MIKKLIILAFVLGLALFLGIGYWNYLKSPVDPKGRSRTFVIQRGESAAYIGKRLQQEGLVRSDLVFKVELKLLKKVNLIEAGDFKLSPAQSVDELIESLSHGALDKWVTIIEGWRAEEVAQKLNQELGIKPEEFLKYAKEGYMFPDTYLFNKEASPADIALTLKNTFAGRYSAVLQSQIRARGLTADQGVILASIVEREARSDQVRTQVAGILLKRLKTGMKLDADATVQYALGYQGTEKSWWKSNLSLDDLKVDSPYNTYLISGLPPTPISNPSLSSLKAVANADPSTPYWYYYHDSKGNSYYARTLEEQNRNAAAHR